MASQTMLARMKFFITGIPNSHGVRHDKDSRCFLSIYVSENCHIFKSCFRGALKFLLPICIYKIMNMSSLNDSFNEAWLGGFMLPAPFDILPRSPCSLPFFGAHSFFYQFSLLISPLFAPCSFLICSLAPWLFLLLLAPFPSFFCCSLLPFTIFCCSLLPGYVFLAPCSLPYFEPCSLLPWVSRSILPAPWYTLNRGSIITIPISGAVGV